MLRRYLLLLPILILIPLAAESQITGCDRDPSCTGNMLTTEVTSGRSAEFVEVDNRTPLRNLSTGLSFQAWLLPQEQPNRKVFVGGLWGPNQDANDQWVVFIEGTQITFELNHPDHRLNRTDNTIVTVDVPDLYTRGWVHLTATWGSGSTSANIYLDGVKVASDSNTTYPLVQLHRPSNSSLQTQIASTNALYDNQNRNRSYLGNMDEVRIWNRALDSSEIRCDYKNSLRGNENGLILYYRFNDNRNTTAVCDAAGNAHWGRMRNSITLDTNLRVIPPSYSVTPSAVTTNLSCLADTTFTFRFLDTTVCGESVTLEMIGRDSALFSLSTTSLTLTQNSPRTVSVRMQASITGDIEATLRVRSANRCGTSYDIPIAITRTTELGYSQTRVDMDTLYVDCIEQPFVEDTIEICNTVSRPIEIRRADIGNPAIFSTRPLSQSLPVTLAPGECWSVVVQARADDTTRTHYDTLRVESDDRCPGSGVVPLTSHTQDVLILLNGGGGQRIDRGGPPINFGSVCPNQISDVRLYQFRNVAPSDTAFIENITFGTTEFFTRRRAYPFAAPPNFAFLADFMRFRPTSAGNKNDTLFVTASFRGCTITKKFAVSGYGVTVDNGFDRPAVDFGSVTIGKTAQQRTTAFNNGDAGRFTAYLKVGDVFRITSAPGFQLATGGTRAVDLEFRPREAITYYDTLCIFDQRCFTTTCIPVSGTGVFDALEFDPSFVLLENVIGCECERDTVGVTNVSGGPLNYTASLPGAPFTVTGPPNSGTLAAGQRVEYIVEYCPNDLGRDRTDSDVITIDLGSGEVYEVLIRANSVVPRLFVESIAFGTIEAGWQQTERILVENISAVPVRVTNVNLPGGYRVVATQPPLPTILGPRDSLWVDVEFAPTDEIAYNGPITVESDQPCDVDFTGDLTGRGKIVRLEVPITFMNFGLNKPCDCTERTIPLPNASDYVPMIIDSIWLDGAGLANANPAYYSWYSKQTGSNVTPYTIDPQSSDTLVIRFCPSGPSDTAQVLHNARLHIAARGVANNGTEIWGDEFETTVSGRREIFFIANRRNNIVGFGGAILVGAATNRNVRITVPDQFLSPSADSIRIDSVSFMPEDRVFSLTAPTPALPWTIGRGETFRIDVRFSPRAPRTYRAKMRLHMTEPCPDIDTTIELVGSGFATKFGWPTNFDTAVSRIDTFRLSTCDTLWLPVRADRDMAQERIDVLFDIDYDTNSLVPYRVTSPFTDSTSFVDSGTGTTHVRITNARNITAGEFVRVGFLVRGSPNGFPISLRNLGFDSDSLVEYDYIPTDDDGWVIVDEPMLDISGLTDFDTVFVKQCADQQVTVWNPGILPVQFDSLSLPPDHFISGSDIPYPVTLAPGDTIRLTVSFCPRSEVVWDTTTIGAFGTAPCVITDSAGLRSIGYAPPWPIRLEFAEDPVQGIIGDTVEVTVLADRYMPVAPIDLDFEVIYNRRALQYLDATTPHVQVPQTKPVTGSETSLADDFRVVETADGLMISLAGIDSLDAGELARLRFIVSVPDTVETTMFLDSGGIAFASDSIFFVKPVPNGDQTTVRVDPRCNITYLNFRPGTANRLSQPTPNPARSSTVITVEFFEDAAARLVLFDASGREVIRIIDGSEVISGGRYAIEIDLDGLPSGDYYYRFEANEFMATERLRIVR